MTTKKTSRRAEQQQIREETAAAAELKRALERCAPHVAAYLLGRLHIDAERVVATVGGPHVAAVERLKAELRYQIKRLEHEPKALQQLSAEHLHNALDILCALYLTEQKNATLSGTSALQLVQWTAEQLRKTREAES